MNLSDWKYPNPVPGIQLLPGPTIMKGGYVYSAFFDSNGHNYWVTKDVSTIMLQDHLITPEPGYNWQTEWFPILIYPNGYELRLKIDVQINPQYRFINWNTFDENGNELPNDSPIKFKGSSSQGESLNLPVMMLKIACFTHYPTDPTILEPLQGMEPTAFTFNVFLGGITSLNLPSYAVVDECTSFNQLDKLKAVWKGSFTLSNLDVINEYINTHGNPIPSDYPFILENDLPNEYDPSEPGGGDGNYDDKSDPIDFPGLPTNGALGSGAIHAFIVSNLTLTQLFQKLWSTSVFDMATWQKLVSSPLDCIISLHALPVLPVLGEDREIWFGNFDTNLMSKVISSQYVAIDCGEVTLQKFFGSAMDFSPYTRVSIFLPFSGIHDLATEDVQGSTIHIRYHIDVLTGDCLIMVKCGQSVLYKFTGNMKMQIPITARDDNALGNTIKGSLGMIGGAIIGGAIGSAPGAIAGATLSAAASVAMHKETVSRSGEITSNTGLMDDFVPYLIIHRPQQSLAVNYNKFKGYPSNITAVLGSLKGYTEVEHIHLENINGATDTELQEIEKLLKNGVII